MFSDRIEHLARYERVLPGAAALAQLLSDEAFAADAPASHGAFRILHKQYETRPEELRRFEVHDHTVDLMICLAGEEVIHLTREEDLQVDFPLPNGADGRKLLGLPQGTTFHLRAGEFIAILPHEAHMVGGRVNGVPGEVDKLVVKLPVAEEKDDCPCVKQSCPRHGRCDLCTRWHRNPDNSLPYCLREKGRAMV